MFTETGIKTICIILLAPFVVYVTAPFVMYRCNSVHQVTYIVTIVENQCSFLKNQCSDISYICTCKNLAQTCYNIVFMLIWPSIVYSSINPGRCIGMLTFLNQLNRKLYLLFKKGRIFCITYQTLRIIKIWRRHIV